MEGLDEFVRAYVECALWSSTDESTPSGGEPMDNNYTADDIHPDSLARMREDCRKFLDGVNGRIGEEVMGDLSRAGHDFWLTRNGHGAGFWDGDWEEETGKALTALSESFGTQDICVGDDGALHVFPL